MGATKPAVTPMDYNVNLTTREFINHVKQLQSTTNPLADQEAYQKLVGKLFHLTMTGINISFSVQTLSQFLQDPKKSYMEAVVSCKVHKKSTREGYVVI